MAEYNRICRQSWEIFHSPYLYSGGISNGLYDPGTCSRQITFDVVDNKLTNVRFLGGCSGNTQGVSKLVEGMDIDEVIKRTDGILCGARPTSCPDQLARALKPVQSPAEFPKPGKLCGI